MKHEQIKSQEMTLDLNKDLVMVIKELKNAMIETLGEGDEDDEYEERGNGGNVEAIITGSHPFPILFPLLFSEKNKYFFERKFP